MFLLGGFARRAIGGAIRGVGRAVGGRGGGSGGWKDLMRELADDHRSLGENLKRNSKTLGDIQLGIEGRGFRELAGALPGSISRGKSDLMRRLTLL